MIMGTPTDMGTMLEQLALDNNRELTDLLPLEMDPLKGSSSSGVNLGEHEVQHHRRRQIMGLLKMLMGSSQAQEGFKDFLNRFEQGNPWEGYDDQEVLDRYGEVSHKVSSSDYEQAARDAFGHLSQTDREEFGRMLAGQAQSRGFNLPGFTPSRGQSFGDLDWLAQITSQVPQQPGLLRDILSGLAGGKSTGINAGSSAGSSAGSILSSPLAKAALAGIAAMLVKRALGSR
jgi:hypothetical protein